MTLPDIGRLLVALGALLSLASFFLPFFATRTQGGWSYADFPMLIFEGVGIMFAVPVFTAFIVLPLHPLSRVIVVLGGIVAIIVDVLGLGATIFVDRLLTGLNFDHGYLFSSHVLGFYLLLLAYGSSIIGAFLTLFASGSNTSASQSVSARAWGVIIAVLIVIVAVFVARYGYRFGGPFVEVSSIKLPPGFNIEIYADGVPEARQLAYDPATQNIFVGTRTRGEVHAVQGLTKKVYRLMFGKTMPSGVALQGKDLIVAEVHTIWRIPNVNQQLEVAAAKAVPLKHGVLDVSAHITAEALNSNFPKETHHGWKYIAFAPDGRLYLPVGAPCNVCRRNDSRFATILRQVQPGNWADFEVFASGIRNSVGFDWHPETKDLWFTENGRDWHSFDWPPDELNFAPKAGMHFGYPWCWGAANQRDQEVEPSNTTVSCSNFAPALIDLDPHAAALAMRFYTGDNFPASYKGKLFVAEHGSWNIPSSGLETKDRVTGYKVALVTLDGNKAVKYEAFATGFEAQNKALGRPVDLLQLPDGSLLLSDDYANRIYRISYTGK